MNLHYVVMDEGGQRFAGTFDTCGDATDFAHSLTSRVGNNRFDVVEVDTDSGNRKVLSSAYDGNYDCHLDE